MRERARFGRAPPRDVARAPKSKKSERAPREWIRFAKSAAVGLAPGERARCRVYVQSRKKYQKVVGRAATRRASGPGPGLGLGRPATASAGERTWRVLGVRRAAAPRAAGRRPTSDVAAGRTTRVDVACVAAIIWLAPGEVAAS